MGFPGHTDTAGLEVETSPAVAEGVLNRLLDGSADRFSEALARVGNCARPIALVGHADTIDTATGEVVSSYSSDDAPLGVHWVPCGNRRAAVCPACARIYASDTFQLIRAGVVGGKTVPESVAENPLVFATLTAPSFGKVHADNDSGDPGSALDPNTYDYRTQIVWQWWAPELWRRFTIALRRQLAQLLGVTDTALKRIATVQYAKVAEVQRRGAIHFHALIRVDGPRSAEGFGAAPASITATVLAKAVRSAVKVTVFDAPAPTVEDPIRRLRFGRQTDVRIVAVHRRTDAPDGGLVPEQVAGYLAKYAGKASADTTADGPADHYRRLREVARYYADLAKKRAQLARFRGEVAADEEADPYERLAKWVDSLGFRGHFSTKSRRYSITLGALRRARRRWQQLAAESRRTGEPLDTADLERRLLAEDGEDDTTQVIGSWSFARAGWEQSSDEALARAAAARAREYAQWKAEQLAA
ncbi:replication initiation protein [Enemella evansiae]|uniref:Replication initiation protein n=1 Tax=Enemella evansiae TaxID=2016499 RepID=A0A255FYP7_9ACTN|nr:replication initiator [Enemella evansiae]OYO08810.1 replication initiation protein [Enemella evansiae]